MGTNEEVFNKTELIFIGTVIKIDTLKTVPDFLLKKSSDTRDSTNIYFFNQFVVFNVKKVLKGHFSIDTIVITTGMGGGDCGYSFQKGNAYVVHTNQRLSHYIDETLSRKKLVTKPFFETNDCERTTSEIRKEIKFLRKFLTRHPLQ